MAHAWVEKLKRASKLLLYAGSLVGLDDSVLAFHTQMRNKKNLFVVLIQFSPGLNKVLQKWFQSGIELFKLGLNEVADVVLTILSM